MLIFSTNFCFEYFIRKDSSQTDFDRNIAKYLARAQSLREDADYDAVDGITENIAKLWINNAEEFMEESKHFYK